MALICLFTFPPPDHEQYDVEFTILLVKGLLSIYSKKYDFDPDMEYPNSYRERNDNYEMLERGRGKSKEARKEIYFQLQKSDKYNDLEVCIDGQLVYLYSKENKEVIFTTNMDYRRYLSIMINHEAKNMSMCSTDCLRNYREYEDYSSSRDDSLSKLFISKRTIEFSEDLFNFLLERRKWISKQMQRY
jgi:hypothetical protein